MEKWFVFSTFGVFLILLISNRFKPSFLFAGLLVLYYLGGLLPTGRFLGSFTNESLVSLILLLLVSIALEKVPILSDIGPWITKSSTSRFAIFKLSAITTFFSAFLNNTAVVAMLMGVLKKQKHLPVSKLLIPLSYFAIVGGTLTLVGTSTNLIVNSFVIEAGYESLKMFDFLIVGACITLGVSAVVIWLAPRMLPDIPPEKEAYTEYFLEAKVLDGSSLHVKTVTENRLRNLEHLFLAEIIRENRLISPVTPDTIVERGDILVFTGNIVHVETLRRFNGLQVYRDDSHLSSSNLVEVVISLDSTLVGKTIKEADFRAKFDASVVALRRGDEKLSGKMAHRVLYAGDSLVLAVGNDFYRRDNLKKNFYVVSGIETKNTLSRVQGIIALGLFAATIIASAFGWITLLKGLLLLIGIYLIAGYLGVHEMKRMFPFDLMIIIGSSLGIAATLHASGAASDLAALIGEIFAPYGAYGSFIGIFLLTVIMTEFMSNNAAAALVFPIALATAEAAGVSVWPFIMAVAYGASASFLSPYGYQTHLMVSSVGGYSLKDFFRLGLPVSVVYSLIALSIIPLVFPF